MATLSYMNATDAELAAALPEAFTYSEARRRGLSDRRLYALRDSGEIEQIGRGLFRRPEADGDPDLIEVAQRAPDATLCLGTALARHGLTDEIPAEIDVALPRNQRLRAVTAPIRWHRFDPDTFRIGREDLTTGFTTLGIYGPERSICDAFRLRHLEGMSQAIEALKRWLRLRGSQPSVLLHMAQHFGPRAENPIRQALQILL